GAAAQVEEVSGLIRAASDPGELFGALRERRDRTPVDPTWVILQTEFWLYAMRNPDVRPKFAERYRTVRRQFQTAIESVFRSIGVELPAPAEDMAIVLNILDEGTAPLQHLDPDEIRPDFFFDALTLLFEASVALSRERASS